MTVAAAIVKDALEEAYADVELLIYDTVHKFIERYGGDFETLVAEANRLFVEGYHLHDNRSSFPTYVRWIIWKGLQEVIRREHRNGQRYTCDSEIDEWCPIGQSRFDMVEFADELSDDAKEVVHLTLNMNKSLQRIVRKRTGSTAQNVKSVLREYLVCQGWTSARVSQSFKEVSEVLASCR